MAKISIGLFLYSLFLSSSLFAASSDALDAHLRGDHQTAAKLWQELANEGDVLAQYNLALLYKQGAGVNEDKNLATYWLTMAARQGMAQAYKLLNTKSVSPSTQRTAIPSVALTPQEWVATQNPRH